MGPCQIRNLIIINFFICCLGCAPSPYAHLQTQASGTPCLNQLKPQFSKILYNAQVNVTGNHLSGLLLFKTMTDSSIRVIFTSEMGLTFFDFEFRKNGFRVVSIQEKMNKKVVINRLRDDLGLLLMTSIDYEQPQWYVTGDENYFKFESSKESIYYVTNSNCTRLSRIETASKKKKKILVNLTDYYSGMPDSVYLAHQSFEYNITLKQISH